MSTPAITLDEILAELHAERLRRAGYSVDCVYDEGLSGATDERVWQRACSEGRLFITPDLDFSDVRRFPPGTHPGILLLRSRTRGRQGVLDVLNRVIVERTLDTLVGCLAVADENQTRVRRPPASDQ